MPTIPRVVTNMLSDQIEKKLQERSVKMGEKSVANEQLVKRLYEAQSRADFEEYFSLLSDEIVYHAAGDCLVSGVHRGKEKLKEIGMITFKETEGTHRVTLKSIIANDSYVAAVDTWKARRKGINIEMDNLLIYRIENEKIIEIREFIGNVKKHDDFWR